MGENMDLPELAADDEKDLADTTPKSAQVVAQPIFQVVQKP